MQKENYSHMSPLGCSPFHAGFACGAGNTIIEINKSNSMFSCTVNIIGADKILHSILSKTIRQWRRRQWTLWFHYGNVIRGMGITILNLNSDRGMKYDLKVMVNDIAVDDNLIIVCQKMVPLNTSHCQTMHWNRQSEWSRHMIMITSNLHRMYSGKDNEQALAMALFECADAECPCVHHWG